MASGNKFEINKTVDCGGTVISKKDFPNLTTVFPFRESDAELFAEDIMSRALEIADANSERALDLAGDINAYVPNVNDVSFPDDVSTPIDFNKAMNFLDDLLARLAERPDFRAISQDLASLGSLDDIPDIDDVDIDAFSGEAPALTFPEEPIFAIGDVPIAPEPRYPTVPTPPNWIEPTLPVFVDIAIPPAPVIDQEDFTEILVDEELISPTNTFEWTEEEYSSELLEAIRTVLLRDIQNGSYGIETNDEILMWQRSREREQMALNQNVEEANREWAISGFTFPPGALANAVERANQQYLEKTSSLNREQTLEHSNKFWDGKKFTIEQSRQFEQMLINYHNAVQERALNAAKAQVEVAINIFNAHVARFKANHERYQIKAQVFETKVRAQLTKVEIYKAQIDGVNALVNLNKSRVDLYVAQLDGIKSLVDRYRVEVEAYSVMANVEKIKTDIFRSQVEAFIGTVQAKEAEFKAYEAAIRGQTARVDAYRSEAEAYKAYVDGLRSKVEADKARVEAYVSKNRGVIDAFEAESNSLNSLRQAQLSYNQNLAQLYQADVQRFAAEADAAGKAFDMSSKYEEIEYRVQLEALQLSIENAKNQLYRLLEISKVRLESLRAAGDVHRSLAAAALSAINCNASLSDSVGYSVNKSGNISTSYSYAESMNEAKQCSVGYSESANLSLQESFAQSESISEAQQTSTIFSFADDQSLQTSYQYQYNF